MQPEIESLASRLAARFGDDILSASALVRGGAAVVARQAERLRGLRVRTLVEVGTRYGAFAALLGRLAETVFTLDLHKAPIVPDVLEFAGAANVVPLLVASDAAKARLLDALDFDLAFIDGDHTREGAARDFDHTRRCGVVLFHDYADPGFHGVTEFVDSLTEGTIVRDAPFAWWFAPGVVPFDPIVGGASAPRVAPTGSPSWRDGTPFCTAGLRCH